MSSPTHEDRLLEELEATYLDLKGGARQLRPQDRLREDLGIDSLTAQELIVSIENRYELDLLNDPRLVRANTVGDLLEVLVDNGAGTVR
jgi:acyl carrier protein